MDDHINQEILDEIRSKGFSRIPVHLKHDEDAVVGILIVKSLIGYVPAEECKTLRELYASGIVKIREPYFCERGTKIGAILDHFKQGYTHMAIVCLDAKNMTEKAHEIMIKLRLEDNKDYVTDEVVEDLVKDN